MSIRFAIVVAFGALALGGAKGNDATRPWRDASSFLFKEAAEGFRHPGSDLPDRERKLGEGLVLLNTQPRSQVNIQRAISLLQEVAQENPIDDLGLVAKLSEARALVNHLVPPDSEKAKHLYSEVMEAMPGHPVAELAAARLAILELYDDVPTDVLNERARKLAGLASKLKTPEGRANFYYTVGMALVELRGDSILAEKNLRDAMALGLLDWQNEGRMLVALGAAAELNGDLSVAAEAYSRFVEKFRRDRRTYTIKDRLEKVLAQREKTDG